MNKGSSGKRVARLGLCSLSLSLLAFPPVPASDVPLPLARWLAWATTCTAVGNLAVGSRLLSCRLRCSSSSYLQLPFSSISKAWLAIRRLEEQPEIRASSSTRPAPFQAGLERQRRAAQAGLQRRPIKAPARPGLTLRATSAD